MTEPKLRAEDYASHIRVFTGHLARKGGKATLLAAADLLVAQEKRLEPLSGIDDVPGFMEHLYNFVVYGNHTKHEFLREELKKAMPNGSALFPKTPEGNEVEG